MNGKNNEQNIVIRRAKDKDINCLVELLTVLLTIETDFIIDTKQQKKGLPIMLEQSNQCCIIVAEHEGQVVGMCTGQLLTSTSEGGLKVILEDLVVAAEHRGRGIASLLVNAVEEWVVKNGALRIDLLADRRNIPALNFYKKHNWNSTELIALQKYLP
ncbi:acetyltransferase YpeA [Clostridium homopropionicum DSM 5847]|uniref:Acetyltransferase YpeA n=2 Tax=Clostridium TaxID=1485 RepID=A0A0L6Z697_9CLOT|nr:acetyltransferase YpeA [Clostridium homopropionicum DSM 5847]SFF66020.1 Ribosomal protein S18 acetylase RimI [Clostridium homopropionicum]